MDDPVTYEASQAETVQDADEILPAFINAMSWKENETILDYGCATGTITTKYLVPQATKYSSSITAVDVSNRMLDYALKHNACEPVTYLQGDIQENNSPLHFLQFDKIFSFYVLHFLKDYQKALETFNRMLKPDGYFGFTVVTRIDCYRALAELGQDQQWSKYMTGYEKFIPEWYEQDQDAEECFRTVLSGLGMEIVELKTEKKSYPFKLDVMLDFYVALYPFSAQIPPELMNNLKNQYRELILKYQTNGSVNPKSGHVDFSYEMVSCLVKKPN